ncbi:MAG: response regulator, partial [Stenotrophomonas sp.]
MTIRVYLVDDHALVRTGMKMILSNETDIEVVGEADSGEDALPEIRHLRPDVVLCDLHLPGVSGMEVTERLVRGDHGTRVVIVSVLEDGPMPKRLLEAGASGYIGKGCDAQELLRAVRDAAMGRRYLGSSIAQNLALSNVEGSQSPFDTLSPREITSPSRKGALYRFKTGATPPTRSRAAASMPCSMSVYAGPVNT